MVSYVDKYKQVCLVLKHSVSGVKVIQVSCKLGDRSCSHNRGSLLKQLRIRAIWLQLGGLAVVQSRFRDNLVHEYICCQERRLRSYIQQQ